MRAKYQDNLEMLQWIKRYFDLNYNGAPYDAVARRKNATLYLLAGCGQTNISVAPSSSAGHFDATARPATASGKSTGGVASHFSSANPGSAAGGNKKVTLQSTSSPSSDEALHRLKQDYDS